MNESLVQKTASAINRFTNWLDRYGEISFDHQSFFASDIGRSAKALYYRQPLLGTFAVSPMIFCEAVFPAARTLFWKAQRFPIADAHYAMGFAFLYQTSGEEQYHRRAVHFLEVLKETRCPGFQNYGWGYPFNWETRNGTMKEGTPLITTLPYAYEAFREVYKIDKDPQWREIMQSIAQHALLDYRDFETSPTASTCCYDSGPENSSGVINASAYRAGLLTMAAADFSEQGYAKVAERNLNFVIESQNTDGSWFYSTDGKRDFVDHFHTCFVLKALAKIEQLAGSPQLRNAIERGVSYYVKNLFDSKGLPAPFSKRPRLTVYRHELYDYAECINLAVLLEGRFPELDKILVGVLTNLLAQWQKRDGSFRARKLMVGWDNVPMHRWAQSQVFRSLCFLLTRNGKQLPDGMTNDTLRLMESSAVD
jgi:hypothetical protein